LLKKKGKQITRGDSPQFNSEKKKARHRKKRRVGCKEGSCKKTGAQDRGGCGPARRGEKKKERKRKKV